MAVDIHHGLVHLDLDRRRTRTAGKFVQTGKEPPALPVVGQESGEGVEHAERTQFPAIQQKPVTGSLCHDLAAAGENEFAGGKEFFDSGRPAFDRDGLAQAGSPQNGKFQAGEHPHHSPVIQGGQSASEIGRMICRGLLHVVEQCIKADRFLPCDFRITDRKHLFPDGQNLLRHVFFSVRFQSGSHGRGGRFFNRNLRRFDPRIGIQAESGDPFRQRLQKLKGGMGDIVNHPLLHHAVIDRIGEIVAFPCPAGIVFELQMDGHILRKFPFMFQRSDDHGEPETAN